MANNEAKDYQNKKPIHKRWWFWVLAVVIVGSWIVGDDEESTSEKSEETEEVNKEDNQETNNDDEVTEKEDTDTDKEEKPKERTIKVEKEIELNGVTVEVQTISIEDDKVTIPIWWSHWTSYDKAHLSLLLIPVAYQGDESLEMTDGEDTMLKQKEKGIDDRAVLEFELLDDETPIDIKFIETTDEAKEKDITIEID